MGRVGVEPTMFLMWQIYSLLSSPTGHTDPYMAQQRGLEPPTHCSGHPLSKRGDYHYHTAAYFAHRYYFHTISSTVTAQKTGQTEKHVTDVLWRQGWASNPQGSKKTCLFSKQGSAATRNPCHIGDACETRTQHYRLERPAS